MPAPTAPYRIEALGKTHDRTAFACGSAALDRYLQQQARQDADKSVAAPFVLTTPPAPRVLGYYTLSAALVNASELPGTLAKKLPRYPHLPVTLLGRLAVDQGMKGKGVGQFLLMDALRRSFEAAAHIAAMAVLVDAKDDAAQAFYRHFSFLPLHEQPRRLFLPMKTIAGLFATRSRP
ncbi:MAG TPA: GNAT family N-acetyltransferase [Burkholderiaceae bacterium]|nr:GNAT family N-acetyltransferase [Burkholderiaceae bacterium]